MTKVLKIIKKIDRQIKEKKSELRETEISTFYDVFSTDNNRKKHIAEINFEIKALLSTKFGKIETLQIELNKIKQGISSEERTLILKINN